MVRLVLSLVFFCITQVVMGQTYKDLWKQVQDAEQKDLPQTQRQVLARLVAKAGREGNYGQLLKALLTDGRVATEVSPDSLAPFIEGLKAREEHARDVALKSVYDAVLFRLYRDNAASYENAAITAADYRQRSMTHPDELAAVKTPAYEPFVIKGVDSHLMGDDLLSVIGYETEQYEALHRYYMTTSNRKAQLLTAMAVIQQQSHGAAAIARLDSLIELYGDLEECCEVAIVRFRCMLSGGYTAQQKVAYIDEALQRWGTWKRANELRNARQELTQWQYYGSVEQRVTIPGREQTLVLNNLRGVTDLTMRIFRVKADGNLQLDPNDSGDYQKLKPLLAQLPHQQTRHYTGHPEYELFKDSIVIPGLPVGIYMIELESHPATQVSRSLYFVSDLRVLAQALPDSQMRYVVVNATTGQPVAGATIRLTYGNRSKGMVTTLVTNAKGECLHHAQERRSANVFVTTRDDQYCPPTDIYGNFRFNAAHDSEQWAVFTDRSIYRPGQTVHMAAFLYQTKNGMDHQTCEGRQVKAVLRDANYKVVDEKNLVSDAYGTVSADFCLPTAGLTGQFHVSVGSQRAFFRVEEYKRPTFQVEIPQPTQHYQGGDTLSVTGTAKTYAGVPVQGGRVSYRVERRRAYWWFSYQRYWDRVLLGDIDEDAVVYEGETQTDADGAFQMTMPLTMPEELNIPMFFHFVVTADVTDAAGETHHGEMSLPLGNRKTALTADVEEKILLEDNPSVTFHLRNAAGTDLPADVRYRIGNDKWLTAATMSQVKLPVMKSGRYTLEAVCQGDTIRRPFVVFSLDDQRPVVQTDDWFYVSHAQFPRDGQPVTLQAGASGEQVHILYTIVSGNTILEQGAVDKTDALVNRKFVYQESYGNGLTISYAWVRNGQVYQHNTTLRRPMPDKQLRLKWETFRDRLTPGQQEEWTLSVMLPDGTPATATQFMATLYDKSLDQLSGHSWFFMPYVNLPLPQLSWSYGNWRQNFFSGSHRLDYLRVKEMVFSHFDHDCFPSRWFRYMGTRGMRRGRVALLKSAAASMAVDELAVSNTAIGAFDVSGNDEGAEEERSVRESEIAVAAQHADHADEPDVQLRENLQETAFFYPQLQTDGEGRVTMKFTLPESLTTWRLLGLAHTQDMMYGHVEAEAVATKDVMIQPNIPRFLRQGDQASLSARLFNTGSQVVSGAVSLLLIDPETELPVYGASQLTTLEAGSTGSVTFNLGDVILPGTLLICRMTIEGDGFSDGEQHYLPILPDRERVTVTVPITQWEPGTKNIDLAALFPKGDITTPKLTVEYTNNPAWLMIQALPSVGHPHDDCAICQAASYYANTLGSYILNQSPRAKHVLESWRREQGGETSLMSALEKNQELRDLVLSETPWVADADREHEQKQRLTDFFDENLMRSRLSSAIDNLKKLQTSDGSWSWWPGMSGSFYMTVEISEMLVRLQQMTGLGRETAPLLVHSFRYMDREILELVAEMKKEEKKGHRQSFPSHKALQYLYIYALDGRTPSGRVAQAQDYLKKLLRKESRNLSIYDKAMATIVLNSGQFLKSLHEWSTYKEGMGRYYDTPRAGYSWRDYRIPTQVAVIEAFQRQTPGDQKTIRELQEWLLQEKRTQAWDTPINSVNAIFAFLKDGAGKLDATGQPTTLSMDGKPLETSTATAGLGYVKTARTYQGEHTFTAEKTSTGTSWGAVYAQFMQPMKNIEAQSSELSVRREIISATPLVVGQRVKVRITVEAFRDLDFVQVVDKRAACMEPIQQFSGYRNGYYMAPRDHATCYYYDRMAKGRHVIETEYYIDRAGVYDTGTCTAQCAYAPEFRGTARSQTITVSE